MHRVLVGKPEGRRPLGRPRRRWEDNIKRDLEEVEGGYGYLMEQVQDRERWRALMSTLMNFGFHKCGEFLQPTFLSQCQRPSFTPIQNNRQNYSSIYLDL
jgi:hypothetical protein